MVIGSGGGIASAEWGRQAWRGEADVKMGLAL